jgi:hypothetical protein
MRSKLPEIATACIWQQSTALFEDGQQTCFTAAYCYTDWMLILSIN